MSNSFPMNPLTLATGGRSNTPPTNQQQQQQSSPNSFLQGLSSRLRSQQQQQLPPVPHSSSALSYQGSVNSSIGSFSTGPLSGSVTGGGRGTTGIMDIFDSANIPGPTSTFGVGGSFRSGGGIGERGGNHSSNNNNFGIPVSSGPPSTFDINEFPSLSGERSSGLGSSGIGLPHSSAPGSNRPNYVGQLVKDVHSGSAGHSIDYNKPTFDMDYNDFPALPGAPGSGSARLPRQRDPDFNVSSTTGDQSQQQQAGTNPMNMEPYGHGLGGVLSNQSQSMIGGNHPNHLPPANMTNVTKSGKKGIVTTKEGKVSNIPMGMVTDQFGMIGLLTFIRAAETEQSIVSLALGTDLTSLKLDLNSSDTLYSAFPGPWSESPLKPHEIDYPVPSEYLIHHQVRDKLAPIREKLSRYCDDTLFFLFYMFPNDLLQIGAANELFARDWRYHKDDKVWVTRAPGMPPVEKTTSYERGTYYFFDPNNWRRVAKEFHLDYDRLENKPASAYLQSHLASNNNSGSVGGGSGTSAVQSAVQGNLMAT